MYKESPPPEIMVVIFKIGNKEPVSAEEQKLLDTARASNPAIQEYYEISVGLRPRPNHVKMTNFELWWTRNTILCSAIKNIVCKSINKKLGFELFHEWTVREKLAKQRLKKLIPLYYKYLFKETIDRVCKNIYNRKKL